MHFWILNAVSKSLLEKEPKVLGAALTFQPRIKGRTCERSG